MQIRLIERLAKSIAQHGLKLVCRQIPGGEVLHDIAHDVWQEYQRDRRDAALRNDVQALAQASVDQVRTQAQRAVGSLSPKEQQAIADYLAQVPAMLHRSLSRPSDPYGKTVPGDLALNRPDDLMTFLPTRPTRFRRGERPLPGVDWELEEPLGVGGFGEVWKARHVHLKSKPPVALKFCLDPTTISVLRNEAGVLDQVMQQGRHPGIVHLQNTYLSADPPCLEYELVEGGDLRGLIQELHARKQLTPSMARSLLLQVADIMAFAHQARPPILHNDLKPTNILVTRNAQGTFDVRITDFGIGSLATALAIRETNQSLKSHSELLNEAVRGAYTPLYASPEQMSRGWEEPADPRDDVHALGVIWYQLVTGDVGMTRMPTDWREELEKRGLDEDHIRILAACIASRAAKRPASAVALAAQLRALPTQLRTAAVRVPISQASRPSQPANTPSQRGGQRKKKKKKGTEQQHQSGLTDASRSDGFPFWSEIWNILESVGAFVKDSVEGDSDARFSLGCGLCMFILLFVCIPYAVLLASIEGLFGKSRADAIGLYGLACSIPIGLGCFFGLALGIRLAIRGVRTAFRHFFK